MPPGPGAELRALGRGPTRRLSQSFLTSSQIASAMVRAAELRPGDQVLEVGPGLGILTRELLRAAGRVVCIEVDPELARTLPGRLGSPSHLEVVQADATAIDLAHLVSEPYLVVASLPYHVATPLLFRLLFEPPRPQRLVVMLQREVADRILGRREGMTFLGAAFAIVAEARLVRRVAPGAFYPVPKVHSAVVRLDLLERPRVKARPLDRFVAFLRAGFAQPRQQLHNSLARGLGQPPAEVRARLEELGIGATRRPAELGLDEWEALYERAQAFEWLKG